jgi:hypothetical protein
MVLLRMNAFSVEVYDWNNGWETHEDEELPYGLTLSDRDPNPVSPPSSPREAGEYVEDDWNYYDIVLIRGFRYEFNGKDIAMMNKNRYPRKIKRNKDMRRSGMLKQPGGASCDQRR